VDEQELVELWRTTVIGAGADLDSAEPLASFRPRVSRAASHAAPSARARSDFTALGELGHGGMGVVYRARQASLAREVALKKILPENDSLEAREQFACEARTTGFLDHPNIVPVHELATTPEGELFLAMKLVRGTSWKDLLHPRVEEHRALAAKHDLDAHLAILDSVAHAVAFAHSKGIVHRDLKPENVMVGAFGEVLVMDWGLAVSLDERSAAEGRAPVRDGVSAPAGTPAYMAPELATGDGPGTGPWTDVYLLGSTLHELLTGRAPHLQGRSLKAILRAAIESNPPVFEAGVPEELAAICRRAMARERRDRFASVSELQDALAGYRKHRESTRVADAAQASLDRAGDAADYALRSEAIAGFRQAIVLWGGNERARRGERDARVALARRALAGGDLGLATTQIAALATASPERIALEEELAVTTEARERAERGARRARRALVAAIVTIVLGLAAGTAVTLDKNRAIAAQRDRSIAAEASASAALLSAERALGERLTTDADAALKLARRGEAAVLAAEALKHADLAQARVISVVAREGIWAGPRRLAEGSSHVTAVAVSSNGAAAVGDLDGRVFVADAANGRTRWSAKLFASGVSRVAFAADARLAAADQDGSLVVLRGDDGAVQRRDALGGTPVALVALGTSGFRAAVSTKRGLEVIDIDIDGATRGSLVTVQPAIARLSPDGLRLLALRASRDELEGFELEEWELVHGTCLGRRPIQGGALHAIALSNDLLAFDSADGTVGLRKRLGDAALLELRPTGRAPVFGLDVVPGRVAVGRSNGVFEVWDTVTRSCEAVLRGPPTQSISRAFCLDPGGRWLVSAAEVDGACVWDLVARDDKGWSAPGPVVGLEVVSGRVVVTAGRGGLELRDIATRRVVTPAVSGLKDRDWFAVAAHGDCVAAGCAGQLLLLDAARAAPVWSREADWVTALAFTSRGDLLVAAEGRKKELVVCRSDSGEVVWRAPGPAVPRRLWLGEDGSRVLAQTQSGEVVFVSREGTIWRRHPWAFDALPDLSAVALVGDGGRLELGPPASLALCDWLAPSATRSLALSPDGSRLALAHGDAAISVVDLQARRVVMKTSIFRGAQPMLRFTPNGRHLLAAFLDGATLVLDAATGEQKLVLDGLSELQLGGVPRFAFAGDRFVLGHAAGSRVRVFPLRWLLDGGPDELDLDATAERAGLAFERADLVPRPRPAERP
jgi:WD40 repeat protein